MNEVVERFLAERTEGLGDLESRLISLRQDIAGHELVGGVRQIFNTVGGVCERLGLEGMATLADAAESGLAGMHNDEAFLSPEQVALLQLTLDRIKLAIHEFETAGAEPFADDTVLISALTDIAEPVDPHFADGPAPAAPKSVRIAVDLLDKLLPMVAELAEMRAGFLEAMAPVSEPVPEPKALALDAVRDGDGAASFLIFDTALRGRLSAPLSRVAWLEDVPKSGVVVEDGQACVKRSNGVLPVLDIAKPGNLEASVIVCKNGRRWAGIVVDDIVDIVDDISKFSMEIEYPGSIGKLATADGDIEVIDLDYYLVKARPDWATSGSDVAVDDNGGQDATPGEILAAELAKKTERDGS